MKIENINILITTLVAKTGKTNNSYLAINFIDLATGQNYDVVEKNIEYMRKLQPMNKYKIDLLLESTKYGLKLTISALKEHLGTI